jgi:hypothetical protein
LPLALIREGNGIAAQVLQELGVDQAADERLEEVIVSHGYNAPSSKRADNA